MLTDKNPCKTLGHTCKNNATCENEADGLKYRIKCECPTNYTGADCGISELNFSCFVLNSEQSRRSVYIE